MPAFRAVPRTPGRVMPMPHRDRRMTELLPSERTAQTLKRIATALGCTVEELVSTREGGCPAQETRELLTLWDAIRSEADRRIVLDTAREVVRAQEASAAP
jgi:hypothetical protein